MKTFLAFDWLTPAGYTAMAVGFVALLVLIPYGLFRKDKERTERQGRRLTLAIEDEWADSMRCPHCDDRLSRQECDQLRNDPPVTRPYIVRCDRPTYVDRGES